MKYKTAQMNGESALLVSGRKRQKVLASAAFATRGTRGPKSHNMGKREKGEETKPFMIGAGVFLKSQAFMGPSVRASSSSSSSGMSMMIMNLHRSYPAHRSFLFLHHGKCQTLEIDPPRRRQKQKLVCPKQPRVFFFVAVA